MAWGCSVVRKVVRVHGRVRIAFLEGSPVLENAQPPSEWLIFHKKPIYPKATRVPNNLKPAWASEALPARRCEDAGCSILSARV